MRTVARLWTRGTAVRAHAKRGTVMLLFAMIVVALLGTIAVVIEVGLVRVCRERMQSAADVTALEVLRERDLPLEWGTDGTDQPFERDYRRRERNRVFASWTFAGDLAQSYQAGVQGAGAYIEVAPGVGNVNLGQRLEGSGHSVPVLATNYAPSGAPMPINAAHGDIVSGSYSGNAPAGWFGADGNPIHVERVGYERVDFHPGAPDEAFTQDAVLVRMRRTVAQGFDYNSTLDVQENVSTSGWTIPLVFGAGTPFMGEDPDQGYSIRHHGLPLRATAIAAARPALRAGIPRPDLGEEWSVGVGPIMIWDEAWRLDIPGFWETGEDGEEFIILRIGETDLSLRNQLSDSTIFGFINPPRAQRIGNEIHPIDPPPDVVNSEYVDRDYWSREDSWAPSLFIKNYVEDGNRYWVAGFYRIKTELLLLPNGDPDLLSAEFTIREQIKLTRIPNDRALGRPYIAPRNASATLDGRQDPNLPEGVWDGIFESLRITQGLVQAPALVR